MGNPIMGAIRQMIRGFANPQKMAQELLNNNKIMSNDLFKNGLQMFQNGKIEELTEFTKNVAREKGTTIDQVKSDIMREFGMR